MKKVSVPLAIANKYEPFSPIVGTMIVPKSQLNSCEHGQEAEFIWDFIRQNGKPAADYVFGFSTSGDERSLVDGLQIHHERCYAEYLATNPVPLPWKLALSYKELGLCN